MRDPDPQAPLTGPEHTDDPTAEDVREDGDDLPIDPAGDPETIGADANGA